MAQSLWCRSLPSDRVMPCRAPDPSSGRPGRCRVCAADSWFQPQQAGQAVPRAERQVCCFPGAGPQMHHAAQRRRRRSLGGCSDPGDGGEEHLRLWATPPDGEGVPRLARPAWLRLAHRLAQPPRPGPPAPHAHCQHAAAACCCRDPPSHAWLLSGGAFSISRDAPRSRCRRGRRVLLPQRHKPSATCRQGAVRPGARVNAINSQWSVFQRYFSQFAHDSHVTWRVLYCLQAASTRQPPAWCWRAALCTRRRRATWAPTWSGWRFSAYR